MTPKVIEPNTNLNFLLLYLLFNLINLCPAGLNKSFTLKIRDKLIPTSIIDIILAILIFSRVKFN